MLPCLPTPRTFEYGGLRSVLQWSDRQAGGGFPPPLPFFSRQTFGGRSGTIISGGVAGTSLVDLYYQRQVYGGRAMRQLSANALWDAPEGAAAGDFRTQLTGDQTVYVRTDGSDSNNGLADNAGGAFLTIQKAVDVVAAWDVSIFTVTIQVRSGTYNEDVELKEAVGSGDLILLGDETTPSNCIIDAVGPFCVQATAASGNSWNVRGFRLQGSAAGALFVQGCLVNFQKLDFGVNTTYHIFSGGAGGFVNATDNYSISGGAAVHWACYDGSILAVSAKTVTITGTPAFGVAFALAARCGSLGVNANTFSGAATGPRFSASLNGVIDTVGGGATYLPGNVAGSTATGGQYA
jgi:hypothetical protein